MQQGPIHVSHSDTRVHIRVVPKLIALNTPSGTLIRKPFLSDLKQFTRLSSHPLLVQVKNYSLEILSENVTQLLLVSTLTTTTTTTTTIPCSIIFSWPPPPPQFLAQLSFHATDNLWSYNACSLGWTLEFITYTHHHRPCFWVIIGYKLQFLFHTPTFTPRSSVLVPIETIDSSLTLPTSHFKHNEWLYKLYL